MKKILPLKISQKAIDELLSIIRSKGIPVHYALRIGVRGGGCSGASYLVGFDEKTEFDDEFVTGGIRVIIDKRHMMYLIGKTVDFHSGTDAMGFVFRDAGGHPKEK